MNDNIICFCHGVSYNILCDTIKKNNIKSYEKLKNFIEIGDICESCMQRSNCNNNISVLEIIETINNKK